MNICVNCKHHDRPIMVHRCLRVSKVDPIDGTKIFYSCESERSKYGTCGPDGRHFEKKGEQNES